MIYGYATKNSTGDKDVTRTFRDAFYRLLMTRRYTSVTTRSAAETFPDTSRLHRDPPGSLKDAPDGFTDHADTRGWGLRI